MKTIFLIICLACFSAVGQPPLWTLSLDPKEWAAWGPTTNGLQMAIRLAQKSGTNRLGQSVVLSMGFRNSATNEPYCGSQDHAYYDQFNFRITKPSGKVISPDVPE